MPSCAKARYSCDPGGGASDALAGGAIPNPSQASVHLRVVRARVRAPPILSNLIVSYRILSYLLYLSVPCVSVRPSSLTWCFIFVILLLELGRCPL